VNLGDLVSYKKGFAFKSSSYQDEGVLVVRVSDTTGNTINLTACKKVSFEIAKGLKDYQLMEDDVVIMTVGSWPENPNSVVGKVIKVPKGASNALLNQNAVRLRANNKIDQTFLYFTLKDTMFSSYLLNAAQGSANQASITLDDIFSFRFPLPSLPEQKAIASILSSLDDKIDLLHRQNKTLEGMAEALFRKWFVVGNGIKLKNGKFDLWIKETVSGDWGKEQIEGDFNVPVYCIRGTDVAALNSGLPTKTPIRYVTNKKFEIVQPNEGDIIIEISGGTEDQSTGRTTYINNDVFSLFNLPLVFSNFCRLLKVKKREYSYFVYLYLQYLYKQDEFFNLENGSSGIKNLNYKALLFELDFPMPEEQVVFKFDFEVSSFFKKINRNKKQIQQLEKLRDVLLPKLMSGEVRVGY
jgi:type I restriction enzyme S subunit